MFTYTWFRDLIIMFQEKPPRPLIDTLTLSKLGYQETHEFQRAKIGVDETPSILSRAYSRAKKFDYLVRY